MANTANPVDPDSCPCTCQAHQPLKLKFSKSGSRRGELAQLAQLSGVSGPQISQTLSGKRTPSVRTLVALSRALSRILGEPVTVDRLLRIPAIRKRLRS